MMVGYAALQPFARGSSAVSSEARAVRKAASEVVDYAERSQSLFGPKAAAIAQLCELADECAEDDWDGEGAVAIAGPALEQTLALIRALPEGISMPEAAPEPDGSISLDWIHSRHRLFSLSIGCADRLAYAWLDGADKGHGVARFDGCNLPKRILEGIQATVNHGNASLWAA